MKKRTINCSIPATLSFSEEEHKENERFTRGQLRVFYKGETADHRLFNEQFSESIIKSLPYTPIVSYYDEEKDDFVGHATEQSIYGIVDPRGEVTFEKGDDGNIWAICDTVYYTERPDKVGEIAKKIEGHSQSLELDPTTVKYTVNYDERKHFKNIEFTAGHFVGVSVLGKDQKPAFTGSAFFTSDELFEAKMKLLKEHCEHQNDPSQTGGTEMNLSEFITLSWGEKSHKVMDAVDAEYSNEYFVLPVDMYDDRTIVRMYSYIDGTCKLMSIDYSIDEDGNVTLGGIKEVHIVYEDVPAPTPAPTDSSTMSDNGASEPTENSNLASNEGTEPSNTEDTNVEITNAEENSDLTANDSVDEDAASAATTAELSTIEDTTVLTEDNTTSDFTTEVLDVDDTTAALNTDANDTQPKVGAVDEQNEEENSSSAPLTDGERAEFETLKREKKENLLNSYKDYLSEEEYNSFFATIDSVEEKDLEVELLKAYKNFEEKKQANSSRAFSLTALLNATKKNESKESELANYIGDLLHR